MVLPHEKAVLCCMCVVDVFRTHWQKHMLFQTGKKGSIKSETAELHENPGCAQKMVNKFDNFVYSQDSWEAGCRTPRRLMGLTSPSHEDLDMFIKTSSANTPFWECLKHRPCF